MKHIKKRQSIYQVVICMSIQSFCIFFLYTLSLFLNIFFDKISISFRFYKDYFNSTFFSVYVVHAYLKATEKKLTH